MRTIPPPIRNLELRDRLSELLKQALQTADRAAPLYLLRSFGAVAKAQRQAEVSRDALIQATAQALGEVGIGVTGEDALDEALAARLLRPMARQDREARLVPGEELQGECAGAASRVEAYCRALEALTRREVPAASVVERALEQAACLFNEGLFFEVHEVLEAVWLLQEGRVRTFLQGLIQIAVGFHHLESCNLTGARALLTEGVEKVKGCGPDRFGVDLDRFLAQVEGAQRSIESLGQEAFDRFDRKLIPRMPRLG